MSDTLNQVPGMPEARCHACGLDGYPCSDPLCPYPERHKVERPTDQGGWHNIDDTCEAAADLIDQQAAEIAGYKNDLVTWPLGTRVRKRSGSSWQGRIVGFYATSLTPVGYCVESEREPGSVQIYPEAALEPAPEDAP